MSDNAIFGINTTFLWMGMNVTADFSFHYVLYTENNL